MEVLASLTVLVLLVVLVTQLTNGATATATNSRKHMDVDSQARLVFDRMANDFDRMVKRRDVDCIFYKNYVATADSAPGQNDAMFFYSEAPAYYDTAPGTAAQSTAALVGYRINSSNTYYSNVPVLERLGKGLTWDGAPITSGSSTAPGGVVMLTTPSGTATPMGTSLLDGNWKTIGTGANGYSDGVDSDYHVLSDQVFRLEVAFLLRDGTTSVIPVINPALSPVSAVISGTSSVNNLGASTLPTVNSDSANDDGNGNFAVGARWFDTSPGGRGYICINATPHAADWNPIGVQDVSAVIVAIAILDPDSRKIVPVTSYSSMIGSLPDPVLSSSQLMAQTWTKVAGFSSAYAKTSGIPQSAASQIRIYQRYFYLNYK